MQVQRRYHEISHFRAPYKDSVFNGYGVYEGVGGAELHGLGEYMPVSGMGEYERVEGLGEYERVEGFGADAPGALLQAIGNLQMLSGAGTANLAAMLEPYMDRQNALVTGSGGDVAAVVWIGDGAPPVEMGTGPFLTLRQVLEGAKVPGMVALFDTQLTSPTPGKRSVIVTMNPDTVAKAAYVGGPFFMVPGTYAADATVVAAAQKRVPGKSMLASLGPLGAAGLIVAAGAGVWMVMKGRKGRRGRRSRR